MDTCEVWKDGRPTFNRLPGINEGYSENVVADWLTDHPDQVLQGLRVVAEVVAPMQVDPLVCEETWLDLLASLCGWHGYWDLSWPTASKRQLLNASYSLIWPNYGSATVLSFVLNSLGVTHIIQQGQSFLVGVSEVGDPLGAIAWRYDIILPTAYYNSERYSLAVRINELFGPIFCQSSIKFDDEFFSPAVLLALDESALLSVDENQTVLEL